jgi:hypothetical protein
MFHKERLGIDQMVVGMRHKWLGTRTPPPPKEGENHPFIARYENLLLGCQMIRLVQQTPDLSGGNLNSNGHIIYWTSVVYDQASPINGSGSR